MMRHAFKLVWNRKGSNALVGLEIFVAFLVLFGVVVLGAHFVDNARRPLGYDYADVWEVSVDTRAGDVREPPSGPADAGVRSETTRQLFLGVRSLDEVVAVAAARTTPYGVSTISSDEFDGRPLLFDVDEVTDDFAKVMGLEVLDGRFFGREDDGDNGVPVVLNAEMARRAFGAASPVGKSIPSRDEKLRVVGVVREYRRRGEYASPGCFLFKRSRLEDATPKPVANLLVRTKPGTPRDFEQRLIARLRKAAPAWSFVARPVPEARASSLRLQRAPVVAFAVVALFLIVMVALGLSGVLWQNVTGRTREIGLRRAMGANVRHIHMQILGELFVVASIAIGLGVIVVLQFPLLDVLGFIRPAVYGTSLAAAAVVLFALTLACGLTPSRLAASGMPAEALRDE